MARDLVDRDRHNKALGLFSAHEAFVHGQPGGKRLVQRTDGFDATIVSGSIVYRDGEPTGALPGRLIRSR